MVSEKTSGLLEKMSQMVPKNLRPILKSICQGENDKARRALEKIEIANDNRYLVFIFRFSLLLNTPDVLFYLLGRSKKISQIDLSHLSDALPFFKEEFDELAENEKNEIVSFLKLYFTLFLVESEKKEVPSPALGVSVPVFEQYLEYIKQNELAAYSSIAYKWARILFREEMYEDAKRMFENVYPYRMDKFECAKKILFSAMQVQTDSEFVMSDRFDESMPQFVHLVESCDGSAKRELWVSHILEDRKRYKKERDKRVVKGFVARHKEPSKALRIVSSVALVLFFLYAILFLNNGNFWNTVTPFGLADVEGGIRLSLILYSAISLLVFVGVNIGTIWSGGLEEELILPIVANSLVSYFVSLYAGYGLAHWWSRLPTFFNVFVTVWMSAFVSVVIALAVTFLTSGIHSRIPFPDEDIRGSGFFIFCMFVLMIFTAECGSASFALSLWDQIISIVAVLWCFCFGAREAYYLYIIHLEDYPEWKEIFSRDVFLTLLIGVPMSLYCILLNTKVLYFSVVILLLFCYIVVSLLEGTRKNRKMVLASLRRKTLRDLKELCSDFWCPSDLTGQLYVRQMSASAQKESLSEEEETEVVEFFGKVELEAEKEDLLLTVGEGRSEIADGEYANHDGRYDTLRRVCVADSVSEIGEEAFMKCGYLMTLEMGQGVKTIGKQAFAYCGDLSEIVFSPMLEEIGEGAFAYCRGLTEVRLPIGTRHIGEKAFFYAHNLEKIYIPSTVETIGFDAFEGCRGLTIFVEAESCPEGWGEDFAPEMCAIKYGIAAT